MEPAALGVATLMRGLCFLAKTFIVGTLTLFVCNDQSKNAAWGG